MKHFFIKHAKSSAMLATLAAHAILLILATGFVAIRSVIESAPDWRAVEIFHERPSIPTKLHPLKSARRDMPPKIQPQAKPITSFPIKTVDVSLPPITMVGIPLAGSRDADSTDLSIGFNVDLGFFDLKSKGEKVCYIVHFGPATIGKTPYSRMTGYTIRKRLEEYVRNLPEYVPFNVACYWANDTCAMSPVPMLATPENKQKVSEWMSSANPLEGDYDHCFDWKQSGSRIESGRSCWPTRIEQLPSYSTRWAYPYSVPDELEEKYLGEHVVFKHWGRGVAWAMLTQKPDTIFILTTNYIDGWGNGNNGQPSKMASALKQMARDIYGPDGKKWPTIHVVMLSNAGDDQNRADQTLNNSFRPIVKAFNGNGHVIGNIAEYMNREEKEMLKQYAVAYGN